MTIIAHHRGRVYSDRQMTCDWCNKVIDPDVDDWGREGSTVWHERCVELENVKEGEAFTCCLCEKVIGYVTWDHVPAYVYCTECKEKYK